MYNGLQLSKFKYQRGRSQTDFKAQFFVFIDEYYKILPTDLAYSLEGVFYRENQ